MVCVRLCIGLGCYICTSTLYSSSSSDMTIGKRSGRRHWTKRGLKVMVTVSRVRVGSVRLWFMVRINVSVLVVPASILLSVM